MTPEAKEQSKVIIALNDYADKYPEINMIFHIPNGGSRNVIEAKNLKLQGVKAGVPDLFLPIPKNNYHGLFIEFKPKKGIGKKGKVLSSYKPRQNQLEWIEFLKGQNYKVKVCYGVYDCLKTILDYLKIEMIQSHKIWHKNT